MNGVTDPAFKPYILVYNSFNVSNPFVYTFCDSPSDALAVLTQLVAQYRGGEAVLYSAVDTATVPIPQIQIKPYP